MTDPFATLAVGLTADTKARRGRPPKAKPADAAAAPQPETETEKPEVTTETAEVTTAPTNVAIPMADGVSTSEPVPPAPGEDAETVFDRRCERLVRIAEEAEFESGTALGDLVDLILDLFKSRPKLWSAMSTDERNTATKLVQTVAQKVLAKVVQIVAEEECVSVQGELAGKFTVAGDAIKVEFSVKDSDMDTLLQMKKMAGHRVVVISADDKRFASARRDPTFNFGGQAVIGFAEGGTLSPDPEPEKPAATPLAGDTDLADGADDQAGADKGSAADTETDGDQDEEAETIPELGVFDEEENLWLMQDGETWEPVEHAGRWPADEATGLAVAKEARARELPA